ncbi:Zeta-crystallin [Arthrobotrys entomopaga]|nr:Zeta-crystallin [Arthrobotrys entomopaga]
MAMHIAQVSQWAEIPKYVEAEIPEGPAADSDFIRVKLVAAGAHQIVRSRAAGTHYSSKTLPHVPGTDGVGITSDGQYVFFTAMGTGSFREYTVIPKKTVYPLPEGIDPLQAAAFVNPGLASWMALRARTENLPQDFTVLIMGVTSASGATAIPFARALGAKKVIGVGRNPDTLAELDLDDTILLQKNVTETDFSKANDADVILDFLYGPVAEHLFKTIKPTKPVQYVHIGGLAGLEATIPGSVLRSNQITIRGAGPGSWSMGQLGKELPALLKAFTNVKPRDVKAVPLSEIEKVWSYQKTDERVVYTA